MWWSVRTKHMIVGGEAEKKETPRRPGFEVERLDRLFQDDALHLGIRIGVRADDRRTGALAMRWVDKLVRLAVVCAERRSEHLVTGNERVPCFSSASDVERAAEAVRHRHVVGRAALEWIEKPESPLREREREANRLRRVRPAPMGSSSSTGQASFAELRFGLADRRRYRSRFTGVRIRPCAWRPPCRRSSTMPASPATVGSSKMLRRPISTSNALRIREITRVASSEWPPRSKKLSVAPIGSIARTSLQMPASVSSIGVADGARSRSPVCALRRGQRRAIELAVGAEREGCRGRRSPREPCTPAAARPR